MAEPVIRGALLRIAQNAVSLRGFFEFFFGAVVAGIPVGMILQRELPVCAFQYLVVAVPVHAENFIVIAFRHAHLDAGWTATLTIAGRSMPALKIISSLKFIEHG